MGSGWYIFIPKTPRANAEMQHPTDDVKGVRNILRRPHVLIRFPSTASDRTMRFVQTISTCVFALSSLISAANLSNPLKKTDGSDPHVVWTGGYYYLMTTTWSNLQITRAKTLEGLKNGEKKTVWTDVNTNRNANMWAVSGLASRRKTFHTDAIC